MSEIRFDVGKLTEKEAKAILQNLPLDITFADKDDIVQWHIDNLSGFLREKSIIGKALLIYILTMSKNISKH